MTSDSRLYRIFLFILLIVILIIINNTPLKHQIRNSVRDISTGFLSFSHFVMNNFSGGIHKMGDYLEVYREREALLKENARLRYQLIEYEEMKSENDRLRELLDFEQRNELKTDTSALIIGRDVSASSDYITINRGKSQGLKMGTVLISSEGLVGHITSIGEFHATGLLISDIKSRVSAMVQSSRVVGILEGTPTHFLKLKNLDINGEVRIGDTVITSGFGDIFPKGIPIGKVEMVGTESNNLYLYALVRPFVEFSNLEEVLCLSKKSN